MAMAKRKNVADTDDSYDESVKPRAKPIKSRQRKKQAVTKTNSSVIKAKIRRNAVSSPLLQLPSEVRRKILIYLLGDNLIHIKYFDVNQLYSAHGEKNRHLADLAREEWNFSNSEPYQSDDSLDSEGLHYADRAPSRAFPLFSNPAFRYATCVADLSELSAYQRAVSGNVDVPEDESPDFYIPSFRERHANCKMCGTGHMFWMEGERQILTLDLNVLGVCRQLYEEANHLLWATNTFSFDDPITFGKFFESLNPAQKRNVTSIHVNADIAKYSYYDYPETYLRARWDSGYWGKGLKIASLNLLRGVQTLYLCLNQKLSCLSRPSAAGPEQTIEVTQQADMEPILRLRTLPLKHVTVVVSDDAEVLERLGFSSYRWTAMKKIEYAESIRVQLVDPSGADSVKAEAEAASLARKIEIRDNAAIWLASCKKGLRDSRVHVVRTTKQKDRAEAKAVKATRADQALDKPSGKVFQLQAYALHYSNMRDIAANEEKRCKERVAKARQKYARAMARLGVTSEQMQEEEKSQQLLKDVSDSDMAIEEEDAAYSVSSISSEEGESLFHSAAEEVDDEEESSDT